MKKKILPVIIFIAVLLLFSSSAYAKIVPDENTKTVKTAQQTDKVTSTQYLLFSDIVYEDLENYKNKKISSFADDENLFEKSAKKYYKNSSGEIYVPDMLKKYVGNWSVDKIFQNSKSGFYAVAFKNEETKSIVIAFRGTTDAIGKDGLNDAEFGLLTKNAPQMDDALSKTKSYIKNNNDYTFSTTGHSLGGGLAIELSHYYDIDSQTFNAAQITSAIYYASWKNFAEVYRGFDTWKHFDHVNEQDFVVGTFEYGSLKKAVKHKNMNSTNTFFAHAIQHMVEINKKANSISVSNEVERNFLAKKNELYKDLADYKSLSLGNSKSNILESHKLFISNDVFFAGDGSDYINAKGGNDVLIGGNGNDTLDGGSGDDTYVYYDGDGNDTILDAAGKDKLLIYSDSKNITYKTTDSYFSVLIDSKEVIKIDRTARLDGFCSVPYGENESKKADSFTIKVINSKGNTSETKKIKFDGKWKQVKKANITGYADVDILDKSGNVLATLKNKEETVNFKNLTAFVVYDETKNQYERCIYTKDNSYYFNIRPTKKQKISFYLDTVLIDKTHSKYSAENLSANKNTVYTLRRTSGAPILEKNNKDVKLVKIDYHAASKVKLSRGFSITQIDSKIAYTVKTEPDSTQANDVYWESSDEAVATVDKNGTITTKSLGQTVITATVDGISDSCKVYVLSKIYIDILCISMFALVCLIGYSITRSFKKKKRKKQLKQSIETHTEKANK